MRKVLENKCHRRHPSSEWEIAAGIDTQGNLIVPDLFCRADDGDETPAVLGAGLLEIQVAECLANLLAAQLLSDVAADDLHRPGYGHKLPVLSLRRLPEVEIHQFLFEAWRLEFTVVPVLPLYLFIRKPVAVAALVEGISLGIDAGMIEGMLARGDDALYLERQPAAGTRRIVQKLRIVARAAETVDVLALLGIVGIGSSLVDILHRHRSLQLVHL